jgi:hypothetical protein
MSKLTRRSVLGGILATGALTCVPSLLSRAARRALAQSLSEAYPTIFIHLPGGLDVAMHWDARTGYANRNVQAADIRQTAAGIRWYQPILSPLGAHMEDMALIRNLSTSFGHPSGHSLLWFGEQQLAAARTATPWANYLSSQLLKAHKVAAPTLITHLTAADDQLFNYITNSNASPDPAAAAQRVQKVADFAGSLDVLGGLPNAATQGRVFSLVDAMDARLYSQTVQARTLGAFEAANVQATDLLTQPPPVIWPPDAATMTRFGLSASNLNALQAQNNQQFRVHLALAYQVAKFQLSHVIFIQGTQGGYDTHEGHDAGQRGRSAIYIPAIAQLLAALKATPSPVEAGVSMFDTTHVVITSELTRANRAETGKDNNGQPFDGTGTPHWNWTQAALFGGKFKRGYAFGALGSDFRGVPADFVSGQMNQGTIPTLKNLQATILKASGVDPSGWTDAKPIDAVLRG